MKLKVAEEDICLDDHNIFEAPLFFFVLPVLFQIAAVFLSLAFALLLSQAVVVAHRVLHDILVSLVLHVHGVHVLLFDSKEPVVVADIVLLQVGDQLVAVRHTDYKLIVDVAPVRSLHWQSNLTESGLRKEFAIDGRIPLSTCAP